jgi:hypothetical protein
MRCLGGWRNEPGHVDVMVIEAGAVGGAEVAGVAPIGDAVPPTATVTRLVVRATRSWT